MLPNPTENESFHFGNEAFAHLNHLAGVMRIVEVSGPGGAFGGIIGIKILAADILGRSVGSRAGSGPPWNRPFCIGRRFRCGPPVSSRPFRVSPWTKRSRVCMGVVYLGERGCVSGPST